MMLFLRSLVFNILFYIWMIFVSIGCLLAGIVAGYKGVNRVGEICSYVVEKLLWLCVGITTEFRNRHYMPKDGRFLVACKHQSAWETVSIHRFVKDPTVIMKKELKYLPVFGWVVQQAGSIIIDRKLGKGVLPQMIEGAKRSFENNRPVFIFPEGTRSAPGKPGKYKTGIFALYQALNAPVLPMALNAGYFWPRRGFLKRKGHLVLEYLPLIEPGLDEATFMKRLEETIESAAQALAPVVEDAEKTGASSGSGLKRTMALLAGLGVLGGAYGYIWSKAADHLEQAWETQGKLLKEQGYIVTHGALSRQGFPFALEMSVPNLSLQAPTPLSATFSLKGPLVATASILSPTVVRFSCEQGVEIDTTLLPEGKNMVFTSGRLSGSVPLLNPLEKAVLSFDDAHIGAFDMKVETLKIGIAVHESDAALDIYSVEAKNLDPGKVMIPGFPQVIHHVQGQLSFKGHLPMNMPLDQAVEKFYHSDGVADIGQFVVDWGDLKVETSGTISVDDNLQPLAAFAAEIYGLDLLLEKMRDLGLIHKNLLPFLKTSLSLLKETKPGKTSDHPEIVYHKVGISIQDSDLVIGSIPVLKLSPIQWSKLGV